MAQQQINIGTLPNDGTGDNIRAALGKVNDNATDAESRLGGLEGVNADSRLGTLENVNAATRLTSLEAVGATGMSPKAAVTCATTANITLSGEQTIDGVTTAASRVLVKNQTTAAQNGIYISAAGAWTRATDMDAASEFAKASVYVTSGTANAGRTYYQTNTVTTVGTDAVSWLLASDQSGAVAALSSTAFTSTFGGNNFKDGSAGWIVSGATATWGASGLVLDKASTGAQPLIRVYKDVPGVGLNLTAGHKYACYADFDLEADMGVSAVATLNWKPFVLSSAPSEAVAGKELAVGALGSPVRHRRVTTFVQDVTKTAGNPYTDISDPESSNGDNLFNTTVKVTYRAFMVVDLGPAGSPAYDMTEADLADALTILGAPFHPKPDGMTKGAFNAAQAGKANHATTADHADTADLSDEASRQLNGWEGSRVFGFGHSQVMQRPWYKPLTEFTGIDKMFVWGGVGGTVQPKPNEASKFEGFYSKKFIERAVDEATGDNAPGTGYALTGTKTAGTWEQVKSVIVWAGINDTLNMTGDPAANALPLPGVANDARPLTLQEQVDFDAFLAGGSPSTPVKMSQFILSDGANLTYAHLYHTMFANLYRYLASAKSTGTATAPVLAADCVLYRPEVKVIYVKHHDSYAGWTGRYLVGNDAANFYAREKVQDEVAALWGLPVMDMSRAGINYFNKDWFYLGESAVTSANGDLQSGDPQLYVHHSGRGGRRIAEVMASWYETNRLRTPYVLKGDDSDGKQPTRIVEGLNGRSLRPWKA